MPSSNALLDRYMPEFDVASRHEIVVAAPIERVYAAVKEADFNAGWIVRALVALRTLPARIAGRKKPAPAPHSPGLLRSGFTLLEENAPNEFVLGVAGRFWTPAADLRRLDREAWLHFADPDAARGVWQFACAPHAGGTLLSTQTRVRCNGDAARRQFLRYWLVIGPFSGLIRGQLLRSIRRKAS